MAPLNVEAAEKYLLAIPLLSLSDEPIRIPAPPSRPLERQYSASSCGTDTEHARTSKDLAAAVGASLHVHRAERFLNSLQLEDCVTWGALDFGQQLQARDIARQCSPTEAELCHNETRASDLVNRKGMRGSCFTIGGRQPTPPGMEGGGGGVGLDAPQAYHSGRKDSKGHGPVAWALKAVGLSPFLAKRKEKWSHVEGTSYAGYLVPTDAAKRAYDPNFLDDQRLHPEDCQPEVSLIPFSRPRGLKEELNEQFRLSHPGIHPSITLSKLRNLQKDLREVTTVIPELDMSTVALAWVYFEKLVLGDWVRKSNRKLLAGACLVLAFKFNQHADRALLSQLAVCIRKLDRKDQLNLAALHDAEVKVFVSLEFSLHVGHDAYAPHLHRLLKGRGTDARAYYGPGTEGSWVLGEQEEAAAEGGEPPAPPPAGPPVSPHGGSSRKSWRS